MADNALAMAIGRLKFVWPERSSFILAGPISVATMTDEDSIKIEAPPSLRYEGDAFAEFCHEFVGATPNPDALDPEDAKALIAFIDGDDADGEALDELGTIHKLRTLAEAAS